MEGQERQTAVPGLGEIARTFGRIGLVSFGGPAGQIALMHRVLVEEKRWLGEKRFLHALNYCMLLPGPEAMQLATYIGWLAGGTRGGLIAGLLFLAPGALLIVALSALYLAYGELPAVAGLLFGLKAAVLAVVLEALVKVSRRAIGSVFMAMLAAASFVAIAFLKLPFPAIILAAAAIGAIMHLLSRDGVAVAADDELEPAPPSWARPSLRRLFVTLAIWGFLWFAPLGLLALLAGPGHVYTTAAEFFSKMAVVTFGGAYAVLSYVAQQAVEVHRWLSPAEMLTGLGLAETTPGPLILVLVFVGYLGGARMAGLAPLAGGLGGAAVALWFTFVPCFLWIFAGAPYVETARRVRWLAAALPAVTAAVVGVIANLALWFAIHVLFSNVGETRIGPFAVPAPDLASLDWRAAAIALAAAVALLGFKVNMLAVLGTCALAGVALLQVG